MPRTRVRPVPPATDRAAATSAAQGSATADTTAAAAFCVKSTRTVLESTTKRPVFQFILRKTWQANGKKVGAIKVTPSAKITKYGVKRGWKSNVANNYKSKYLSWKGIANGRHHSAMTGHFINPRTNSKKATQVRQMVRANGSATSNVADSRC